MVARTRLSSGGFGTQRNTAFGPRGSIMAFGVTARVTLADLVDATSFSTSAFTPTASELLIACYAVDRTSSLDPTTPTVSGHDGGTAWALINSLLYKTDTTTHRSVFLFACVTGGSPSSAAVTFSHGATSHSAAFASVFEVSGGDEANGLLQTFEASYLGPVDPTNNTSITISMNAGSNANNRPFAFFIRVGTQNMVPRTNWTEIQEAALGAAIESQWRSDAFETTASVSWTTTTNPYSGIAWELKAAGAGGGGQPMGMRRPRRWLFR